MLTIGGLEETIDIITERIESEESRADREYARLEKENDPAKAEVIERVWFRSIERRNVLSDLRDTFYDMKRNLEDRFIAEFVGPDGSILNEAVRQKGSDEEQRTEETGSGRTTEGAGKEGR